MLTLTTRFKKTNARTRIIIGKNEYTRLDSMYIDFSESLGYMGITGCDDVICIRSDGVSLFGTSHGISGNINMNNNATIEGN